MLIVEQLSPPLSPGPTPRRSDVLVPPSVLKTHELTSLSEASPPHTNSYKGLLSLSIRRTITDMIPSPVKGLMAAFISWRRIGSRLSINLRMGPRTTCSISLAWSPLRVPWCGLSLWQSTAEISSYMATSMLYIH